MEVGDERAWPGEVIHVAISLYGCWSSRNHNHHRHHPQSTHNSTLKNKKKPKSKILHLHGLLLSNMRLLLFIYAEMWNDDDDYYYSTAITLLHNTASHLICGLSLVRRRKASYGYFLLTGGDGIFWEEIWDMCERGIVVWSYNLVYYTISREEAGVRSSLLFTTNNNTH